MKRYLAFDLETAKILPDNDKDIKLYRPLGISCATAVAEDDAINAFCWYGKDEKGNPTNRMTSKEASKLVSDLMELSGKGYTVLTWGGTDFDFDILAEESGRISDCISIARNHVDMLFHVFCSLGYFVSLQKAAEGMDLGGKKAGISGATAPSMWAEGKYKEVIDYCTQDARLTLQIARHCEQCSRFSWITRRGVLKDLVLPNGWATVQEAYAFPLPDTSWMEDPKSRDEIVSWFINNN